MRSRIRRAPTPTAVGEASDPVSELTIHLGLCPPDDVRSGHDDEIEAGPRRLRETTEALAQQPPGPVASDGAPDLPAHRQAKSVLGAIVWQGDHDELSAPESSSFSEDSIELHAHPQSVIPPEIHSHDPTGPCTVRPPAASGPSAAAASGSPGHPSSASGPGSHASAFASDCWVETSSSCCSPICRGGPDAKRASGQTQESSGRRRILSKADGHPSLYPRAPLC